MSKFEEIFKKLVQLQNYISKFGVAIQIKVVQQSLTDTLNGMAEAMKEEANEPNREIVQIAGNHARLYALCKDGTLWTRNEVDSQWVLVPPILTLSPEYETHVRNEK